MDDEDVDQLLEDIQAREERMSNWEREFVESVEDQLRRGRTLSTKQVVIVNRIWDKVTDRG